MIDCPLPSCGRKRWSDPFNTQAIIGDAVDTQGVDHVIDRLVLNKFARDGSGSADRIHSELKESSETQYVAS